MEPPFVLCVSGGKSRRRHILYQRKGERSLAEAVGVDPPLALGLIRLGGLGVLGILDRLGSVHFGEFFSLSLLFLDEFSLLPLLFLCTGFLLALLLCDHHSGCPHGTFFLGPLLRSLHKQQQTDRRWDA